MDVLHIEWRVNGLQSTVTPHLQYLCNCLVIAHLHLCLPTIISNIAKNTTSNMG